LSGETHAADGFIARCIAQCILPIDIADRDETVAVTE
jgi:hypothetical protein